MKGIMKYIIWIILTLLFSSTYLGKSNFLIVFFGIVNSGLLAYILVLIFSNFDKQVHKESETPTKVLMANLLWGTTFLIMNYLKYGKNFKVINLVVILIVVIDIYAIILSRKPKQKTEGSDKKENIFKFGYLWLIGVLLLPLFLILTFKGY